MLDVLRFILFYVLHSQKSIYMANKKTKEPKKPFGYRVEPSEQRKATRKAKREKTTLSLKIANFIYDYNAE